MKNATTLIIGSILATGTLFAETNKTVDLFAEYFSNIKKYNHLFPQEKVYLHFDNSGYYVGENIYFKAYVVMASELGPTSLSKVLYVELIDQFGKVAESKRMRIEDGQCNGEFNLKDYYKSGFYEVRAYTRVMLNNDLETTFSRVFPVFEAPRKEGEYENEIRKINTSRMPPVLRTEKKSSSNLNLRFYPEGGNIVSGNNNRIAFKVTDKTGLGVDAAGVILSSRNDTIVSFNTLHKGMGLFTFTPEAGEKYTAHIQGEKKALHFELPRAMTAGYSMECGNQQSENILINIRKSPEMEGDTLGISVMTNGKLNYANIADLKNSGNVMITVPKKDIDPGVSQITLFDRDGKIMAERLVFVRSDDFVNIEASMTKENYKPLEQVEMNFRLSDKNNKPVSTTFSLTVKDKSKDIGTSYCDNIHTDLLLSSEIKGYIEDVDYYFTSDDKVKNQALDLLMMVQGWRRYDWTKMVTGEDAGAKNFSEDGIIVAGRVESTVRKKIKKDILVKADIYPRYEDKRQATCLTDENGKFNFRVPEYDGPANMNLSLFQDGKKTNGNIVIDRVFSPKPRAISALETDYSYSRNGSEKPEIKITGKKEDNPDYDYSHLVSSDSRLLDNVEVQAKNLSRDKFDAMKVASVVYDVREETDKLIDSGEKADLDIYSYLRQICPNVSAGNRYKGRNMMMVINDYKSRNNMLFFNTSGPSTSSEFYDVYSDLRSSDIEKIAICDDPISVNRYYAQLGSTGSLSESSVLIFLYLKQNSINDKKEKKGERRTVLDGYAMSGEFYMPDILSKEILEDIPYRRTLYWNPNVKSDASGNASIKFYNNMDCESFSVDAQTITPSGTIGILK